jgi:hypothetical protein
MIRLPTVDTVARLMGWISQNVGDERTDLLGGSFVEESDNLLYEPQGSWGEDGRDGPHS